jgi:hypothetical protein
MCTAPTGDTACNMQAYMRERYFINSNSNSKSFLIQSPTIKQKSRSTLAKSRNNFQVIIFLILQQTNIEVMLFVYIMFILPDFPYYEYN